MRYRGVLSRRIAPMLALSAIAAVSTVAPSIAGASPTQTPPPSYVALGDSFTSGPQIPNGVGPSGCMRSDHNYPHLVAPATGTPAFRDVSCGGADTRHLANAQGDNPPQLTALDANTRVVTVGMGGNDIGFADIVLSCVSFLPFGSPCRSKFVVNGRDELSARIAATAPKIAQAITDIRTRSPQARVLVVGYPALVPDAGIGCWPSLPMTWSDTPYLAAKTRELNTMLAAQAAANGAVYVNTYTPSIGHDACAAPANRWVEPLIPAAAAAPFHPNAKGMQGMAAAVQARL